MKTIYFVSQIAKDGNLCYVQALGPEPIAYGQAEKVTNDLAEELLANGDWAESAPDDAPGAEAEEPTEVEPEAPEPEEFPPPSEGEWVEKPPKEAGEDV